MKYKLAINMCCFIAVHTGGKDETAFNLLRGFEKIGVSNQIICLCTKEMEAIIRKNAPNINTYIVPQLYFNGRKVKGMNKVNAFIRRYFERYWIPRNKDKIEVYLFPNKPTLPFKYDVPTICIPHDIQVFERNKLPGVAFTKKEYISGTASIKRDFKNRDHIIAISDFDKEEMIKFFPWAEAKIKRIYDPICFDKMGASGIKGTEYLMVLNIQWKHKNVETVIRAFARIANEITESLVLIGKFPKDIDRMKKLVDELGIADRVKFTGFVSTQELDEIVAKTRIYINASYFEGFGMTAVEMMGRGIPTIVAKNTAQPEVTRGLCYYYDPTDSDKALADVILQELRDPMPQEKLQAIAAEMRKNYSYEMIAREYWDYILECAKCNKSGIKENV